MYNKSTFLADKSRSIQKILKVLLIFVVTLLYTSCLDIYQHVAKEKNGNISIYLKLSVSKALISLADLDSDSDLDCGSLFDDFGEEFKANVFGRLKVDIQSIDDSMECGISIKISANPNSPEYQSILEDAAFIPELRRDRLIIDLNDDNSPDSLEDEIANVLLSAFKYRLVISKTLTNRLDRVVLSTAKYDYKPQVIELSDSFLVEIPISQIISSGKGSKIIAYFTPR